MQGIEDKELIKSLMKGVSILEYLNMRKSPATLSEVAYNTNISRAAARRVLLTLVSMDYVQTQGRNFSLTPKVLKLSSAFSTRESLASVATPYLKEIAKTTGEACSMSVLQGENIVYVAREASDRIMSVNIRLGADFPALYTSMGRAIIANLDDDEVNSRVNSAVLRPLTPKTITSNAELLKRLGEIKAKGYSLVNEELELGLLSMAVPVFAFSDDESRSKLPIAAINIACSTAVHKPNQVVKKFLGVLLKKSSEIELAIQNSH